LVTDLTTGGVVHALNLDATYAVTNDNVIAPLVESIHPYARAATAWLVAGYDGANKIVGYLVDDALALKSGALALDTLTDLAYDAAVAADGAGFLVAWRSLPSGTCRVERVDATGAITAGPATMTILPSGCERPIPISIGGTVIIGAVGYNGTTPIANGAVIDAAFTATTKTPVEIGSTSSSEVEQLLDAGTRALAAVPTDPH